MWVGKKRLSVLSFLTALILITALIFIGILSIGCGRVLGGSVLDHSYRADSSEEYERRGYEYLSIIHPSERTLNVVWFKITEPPLDFYKRHDIFLLSGDQKWVLERWLVDLDPKEGILGDVWPTKPLVSAYTIRLWHGESDRPDIKKYNWWNGWTGDKILPGVREKTYLSSDQVRYYVEHVLFLLSHIQKAAR